MYGFYNTTWKASQIEVVMQQRFSQPMNNQLRNIAQEIISQDMSRKPDDIAAVLMTKIVMAEFNNVLSEPSIRKAMGSANLILVTMDGMKNRGEISFGTHQTCKEELDKLINVTAIESTISLPSRQCA